MKDFKLKDVYNHVVEFEAYYGNEGVNGKPAATWRFEKTFSEFTSESRELFRELALEDYRMLHDWHRKLLVQQGFDPVWLYSQTLFEKNLLLVEVSFLLELD